MGIFKLGPNQREGGEVVGMQAMVKQGIMDDPRLIDTMWIKLKEWLPRGVPSVAY